MNKSSKITSKSKALFFTFKNKRYFLGVSNLKRYSYFLHPLISNLVFSTFVSENGRKGSLGEIFEQNFEIRGF